MVKEMREKMHKEEAEAEKQRERGEALAAQLKDATKELARLRPQLQSQENDIRRQADELDIARSKVTQLGKLDLAARVQHLKLVAQYLDGARRHVGVTCTFRTQAHLAGYLDHIFAAHTVSLGKGFSAVRIKHHLGQAFAITDIKEDDPTMVTATVNPAAKSYFLIRQRFVQLAIIILLYCCIIILSCYYLIIFYIIIL